MTPFPRRGDVNAGRKVKGTLHWVECQTAVPAEIRLYDYLLREDDAEGDFMERLNPNSLEVLQGFVEPEVLKARPGTAVPVPAPGVFLRGSPRISHRNMW